MGLVAVFFLCSHIFESLEPKVVRESSEKPPPKSRREILVPIHHHLKSDPAVPWASSLLYSPHPKSDAAVPWASSLLYSPHPKSDAAVPLRRIPLRRLRISKREGDPLSIQDSVQAFKDLGIYPQIHECRDSLRHWFSSVLLKPLLNKIETSHIKVMQAAAKVGISITISEIGNPIDWKPWGRNCMLEQLRRTLLQALDTSMTKFPAVSLHQTSQQNPRIHECLNAITEHERLHTLIKGEWVKGLLSHSNIPDGYMVQRIRELAEGACLKKYEYMRSGDVSCHLPTDSHLLMYLFCVFLGDPHWQLQVDTSAYAYGLWRENPLFVGVLPKHRLPEKYIYVLSGVPSILHPGACVLAIGNQTLPIFSLYWDKKLQFSLQGITAFWDSISVLCRRIEVGFIS
ncbi:uncharacterized protein [Euphorbia lathyris]|uniref:uncharacterized protein n=1 Tax=Euphorbia lathyris TaxID=212925 RepID=UPI003313772D